MRGPDLRAPKLDKPREALHSLFESLVLSYTHVDDEFVLVVDYPDKGPASGRAFARLNFQGVSSFRVLPPVPPLPPGWPVASEMFLGRKWPPLVVQSAETNSECDGIELWFGLSFGGVAFSFASLEVHVVQARVELHAGDYVYFDQGSGSRLDFYAPFEKVVAWD